MTAGRRSATAMVMGVVLVFRDISDRRRAEIEVERAARQTADILGSIADGFISFDSAFRVLYVNEKAAELLECEDAAALMGRVLWTECPDLAGTAFGKGMLHAMRNRTPVELTTEASSRRTISVRAYPAETGISVYLVDSTENRLLMQSLQTSQERLHRSLHAAKAAIWERDLQTGETVWSGPVRELFGDDEPEALSEFTRAISEPDRKSHQAEFRIVLSGEAKWVRLIGEAAGSSRLSGIALDITERKRLEEKLRDSAKLESLGVLAGGVAHDFNNLLTGILGNASVAAEILTPADPLHEIIDEILKASSRAADLTRQMLAYSGKGSFVIQSLNISGEVREIVKLLQLSVNSGIEMRLLLDERIPPVDADPAQIQQLVMNLVINAAEAIGAQTGAITVTTGVQQIDQRYARERLGAYPVSAGTHVVLEVHDTGHGMDEATQEKMFDPFFSTKFTGRGLGLAAVLGIVRGLRGGIEVSSNTGLGTTFKVFLPASTTPARIVEEPVAVDVTQTSGLILVVDDEQIIQHVVSRALLARGFEVMVANNGLEAIQILQANGERVRLIVLDLTMPLMSGNQALPELRRIAPDVPVLAASGFSESEALHRFGAHVDGFLQKPYTAAKLLNSVAALLGS